MFVCVHRGLLEGTGYVASKIALLSQKPRMFQGQKENPCPKSKRAKHRKLPAPVMMPNLSGVKFEDALKALLKTPSPESKKEKMSGDAKVGRPSLPHKERRGAFISTRLSPDELKEIKRAVRESGKAQTEWVREKLLNAARRA